MILRLLYFRKQPGVRSNTPLLSATHGNCGEATKVLLSMCASASRLTSTMLGGLCIRLDYSLLYSILYAIAGAFSIKLLHRQLRGANSD